MSRTIRTFELDGLTVSEVEFNAGDEDNRPDSVGYCVGPDDGARTLYGTPDAAVRQYRRPAGDRLV